MNVISLSNIGKIYNIEKQNAYEALKNVYIDIEQGALVSIVGESGSGKSTLLHIMGCIDKPTSGEYYLCGKKVDFNASKKLAIIRNRKVGFVLQDFGLILNETAVENVSVPLYFTNTSIVKIKERAQNMLDLLSIGALADKKASELSGGQKQRVAIARALVSNPEIILADEPTGALDSKTSFEIINIFKNLNAQGKTVIIVTHDMGIAKQCERIIKISDGVIIANNKNK